jgi:preprotein translocase subunit SecA
MNQQREIIYEYRDRILEGEDMGQTAREQIGDVIERMAAEYMVGEFIDEWDLDGFWTQLEQMYPVGIALEDLDRNALVREELIEDLKKDAVEAYDEREEELGRELMREIERVILLQIIDERWREHLHDMDYLREGIHLRGFAQIEPLVAYKNEGFEMFTELMNNIWEEFARYIFNVELRREGENGDGQWPVGAGARSSATGLNYAGGHAEAGSAAIATAAGQAATAVAGGEPDEPVLPQAVETRRVAEEEKIGRNDPCWCGSGKKFKKCHGA